MNVITLGGNALLPERGTGTFEEQFLIASRAMEGVAELVAHANEEVVLSHGNGPIVGNILIRNEAARDQIPPMPLDVCGADSQGGIGYLLQQVLDNSLSARGIRCRVVSIVTQCVVDEEDPAFAKPTKPIGQFYSREEALYLERSKGWALVDDAGRGWRRVVPSPRPVEIVEWDAVRSLVASGMVVIAAGGGGVPVVRREGKLRGVEAVIDKDRAAAVLAKQLRARRLIALTSVDQVSLDFGQPTQRGLPEMSAAEAAGYLREGQFPSGSMGPKIEAAIDFVGHGGEEAIITSPQKLLAAVEGRAGTHIHPRIIDHEQEPERE
jgi:carbamate kinase